MMEGSSRESYFRRSFCLGYGMRDVVEFAVIFLLFTHFYLFLSILLLLRLTLEYS